MIQFFISLCIVGYYKSGPSGLRTECFFGRKQEKQYVVAARSKISCPYYGRIESYAITKVIFIQVLWGIYLYYCNAHLSMAQLMDDPEEEQIVTR